MVPKVPVIVEVVVDLTFFDFKRKVAEVLPALIVTDPGTATELVLLDSFTTTPPKPAGLLSVTVPVTTDFELPCTLLGETDSDVSVGGIKVITTF